MMEKPRHDYYVINRADAIISNPNIKTLTNDQKEVLAKHRKHLIEQIKFYRALLEANYEKVAESEELD